MPSATLWAYLAEMLFLFFVFVAASTLVGAKPFHLLMQTAHLLESLQRAGGQHRVQVHLAEGAAGHGAGLGLGGGDDATELLQSAGVEGEVTVNENADKAFSALDSAINTVVASTEE